MRVHRLKTLPDFYEAVFEGDKTAEMREDDRCFQKGDRIILQEYNPKRDVIDSGRYSGRELTVEITHVLHGERWGIKDGYAMLSFRRIEG